LNWQDIAITKDGQNKAVAERDFACGPWFFGRCFSGFPVANPLL
jgi:hypothetical protein